MVTKIFSEDADEGQAVQVLVAALMLHAIVQHHGSPVGTAKVSAVRQAFDLAEAFVAEAEERMK